MAALRQAIDDATVALTQARVASPRRDAEELAAHIAGTTVGRLMLVDTIDDEFARRYSDLVADRAKRVPLQHLTGTAAFGTENLHVGPGVFIPRPETEAMLEWVQAQPLSPVSLIVDLCTGSGALAVALARHAPAARVIAVDSSADALQYARSNTVNTGVDLRHADVRNPGLFPDLDGQVDLIVANPPYLPDGTQLEPEVAQYDPPQALFGGPDGTVVIADVTRLAGRWLRPGGLFAVEHDADATFAVVGIISETTYFDEITSHFDFTGRPRFVTARRKSPP